jgi:hypothetical protein
MKANHEPGTLLGNEYKQVNNRKGMSSLELIIQWRMLGTALRNKCRKE